MSCNCAAGSKWREQISRALDSAKVAVLLVSADFLASEFIANEELPRLFAAAENDGVAIIPVIVSPCAFDSFESLCQFQSINSPAQPLSGLNKTKREQILVKLAGDKVCVTPEFREQTKEDNRAAVRRVAK